MGLFLIGAAVFALATVIFQYFWKAVLRFFYYVLQKAVDVAKKIIVAVRRFGRVVMILFKRLFNGKVYKTEFTEEEIRLEDVPEGLQDELATHEEVVVKQGDINPWEF